MATASAAGEPIVAAADERRLLVELERVLAGGASGPAALLGPGGEPVELPPSVVRVLRAAVRCLARNQAVALVPVERELTTQQAADLLNVSRPYLIRLLDRGAIPYTKTGSHRRVRLDDVLAYKRGRDAERRRALDELVALSQEMGLYELDGEDCRRP